MKKLILYYLSIFIPLLLLIYLSKNEIINSTVFVSLFFLYAFIYRTYIDGKRLNEKGIIEKKEIWKMIIPGKRFEYFGELYLKNKQQWKNY